MLSISSLLEFLLDLLRDDDLQADFDRDPQGTLAAHGLSGVTAQDVRDVRPMLADHNGVRPCGTDGGSRSHDGGHRSHDGGHRSGHEQAVVHHARPVHDAPAYHDPPAYHAAPAYHRAPEHRAPEHHDPVREIQHVTKVYEVDRSTVVHHTPQEHNNYNYELNYYDSSVHADNGSTVVQDSFNQDNDGVDNKGGSIDDSVVGGGDVTDSGNSTDVTVVEDSFNDDASTTVTDSGNETVTATVADSLNDNSTSVADSLNDNSTSVDDSANDNSTSVDDSANDNSTSVDGSFTTGTDIDVTSEPVPVANGIAVGEINGTYAPDAPAAVVDAGAEEAAAQNAAA